MYSTRCVVGDLLILYVYTLSYLISAIFVRATLLCRRRFDSAWVFGLNCYMVRVIWLELLRIFSVTINHVCLTTITSLNVIFQYLLSIDRQCGTLGFWLRFISPGHWGPPVIFLPIVKYISLLSWCNFYLWYDFYIFLSHLNFILLLLCLLIGLLKLISYLRPQDDLWTDSGPCQRCCLALF